MATSAEYMEFVCDRLNGMGLVRTKKMFGEYMVYVDDRPILLVCDFTVFVKKLEVLEPLMAESDRGFPYPGAKEHYILDIENAVLTGKVVEILKSAAPIPVKKATVKHNDRR